MRLVPVSAGTTIQITCSSGNQLEQALVFENCPVDEYLDDKHWLLTREQAQLIFHLWRAVTIDPRFVWVRNFTYFAGGLFTAAECFESEITFTEWESAYGADDFDVYSTSQLPFHLAVERIG